MHEGVELTTFLGHKPDVLEQYGEAWVTAKRVQIRPILQVDPKVRVSVLGRAVE